VLEMGVIEVVVSADTYVDGGHRIVWTEPSLPEGRRSR